MNSFLSLLGRAACENGYCHETEHCQIKSGSRYEPRPFGKLTLSCCLHREVMVLQRHLGQGSPVDPPPGLYHPDPQLGYKEKQAEGLPRGAGAAEERDSGQERGGCGAALLWGHRAGGKSLPGLFRDGHFLAVLTKTDEGLWHPGKIFHSASYEVEELPPPPCCSG